jgi:hypothetical protein
MKTFLALALLVSSVSAFSATVKITSFNYIRTSNDLSSPLAELCGLVEGATASPSFIRVLVDPKSKNPGSYNTLAGADGKFCTAVITFRGTADVSVMGAKESTKANIK